jgi:hypothetical protein
MLNHNNTESADASKQSVPVAVGCPQEGVAITLPDGEIIVVDGVPYDGWGYEPGKWYVAERLGDDGNIEWRKRWVVIPNPS